MTIESMLPEDASWCIAGGYAACPALANDLDLWVFVSDLLDARIVRKIIIQRLAELDLKFETQVTKESSKRLGTEEDEYPDAIVTLKVAQVETGTQPIQIMVTTAKDAQELIDSFDISTHQIALLQDGQIVRGVEWTPITVQPRAVAVYPATGQRMVKICTRYGFPVPKEFTVEAFNEI